MDERDKERVEETPPRVERETTIINTGERRGSGGMIAALVLVVLVVIVAFFVFGGGLEKATESTDINVNVDTPDIKLPDIDIEQPERPSEPSGGNSQ